MNDVLNIIVYHYHFLRGGVRSAILGSLEALKRTRPEVLVRLRIITGRHDGISSFVSQSPYPIDSVLVEAALDYSDRVWTDEKSFCEERDGLAEKVLSWVGRESSIFWIHNCTLGKNPLVTALWYRVVEISYQSGLPHGFVYHIHDFAECGRIENLFRLRFCWQSDGLVDWYPCFPNVCYAVLSRADRDRLIRVGLDSSKVFWVPNVVFATSADLEKVRGDSSKIFTAIAGFAERHGYVFNKKYPSWVMPVRLIRRKNVLEGLLLTQVYREPRNLLITLNATSAQEMPYAETVQSVVRKLTYPAVIGFGDSLVGNVFTFDELLTASEAVVTTSILEGFGFAFLEGLLRGIPLAGRDLPFITNDFDPVGFPHSALYTNLLVPVAKADRERHLEVGLRLLKKLEEMMKPGDEAKERFSRRLMETYGSELVDFGSLMLDSQIRVCENARDVCYLSEIAEINSLPRPILGSPEGFAERVEAFLGPRAHVARLAKVFERAITWNETRAGDNETLSCQPDSFAQKIFETFLDPIYFRPLFGSCGVIGER
ncbi:MAG: hypothetical protein JRI45_08005 [Deltaproteobacteria bacterium]|nr:hypothetical protein [Deltaproteobacteria bacterium]MBW2069362.1 hypothetical protein [Deltaproteobacteria bacterium]